MRRESTSLINRCNALVFLTVLLVLVISSQACGGGTRSDGRKYPNTRTTLAREEYGKAIIPTFRNMEGETGQDVNPGVVPAAVQSRDNGGWSPTLRRFH